MLLLYILKESFLFAFNSLITNKLRTFLSLLGITIGIFAIISVFTVIDSLENSIKGSIQSLGDNVIYVQKWPWSMGGEYAWWKYMKRPVPTFEETELIRDRAVNAAAVTFALSTSQTVEYKENYVEYATIFSAEHEYENIRSFEIESGRYFSFYESQNGVNCCIIGNNIAQKLFEGENPIGKKIKILQWEIEVIGVFKKEGEDLFGMNMDDQVLTPINYIRTIVNIKDEDLNPFVMVKAKENVDKTELIDELRGIMRSIRRLKPAEEDDFALNQISIISQGFEGLFAIIDVAGMVIGGFSIIVGGFGIANIMFVSVKEQTKIIGIQKALGAKKRFILLQFLYEAVVLSLFGGGIGLILVFLLTLAGKAATDFDISLTPGNIVVGLLISFFIGIVSGVFPAMKAAKLDPVVAISSV